MSRNYILNRRTLFGVVCFLVLFLSFFGNFFGTGPSQGWFSNFQKDSSLITEKAANCKGKMQYGGPLTVQPGKDYTDYMQRKDDCSQADYKPYDSQYGLQARVIAFFAPTNPDHLASYFKKVEIVLSLAMAFVFTIFIVTVMNLFGKKVSYIVLGFISISPWIVGYARNMYWVSFLMFLPFVFSFATYVWFRQKNLLWIFFMIIGILFFAKLLDGYEHVTTMMISVLIPVIFYEIIVYNKKRLIDFLKPAIIIFISGCLSLGFAILVNTASLVTYYGSWSKAFSLVAARAEDRSAGLKKVESNVVGGFKATLPDMYQFVDRFYSLDGLADGKANPIKYAALSLLNYTLLPAVSLPFIIREPIGTVLQSIGFIAVISYLLLRWLTKKSIITKKSARGLQYSYWLGLAAAFSWLVLMPGHAYPHAHLNAIIFYMPFLPVCYIIIGIALANITNKWKTSRLNK